MVVPIYRFYSPYNFINCIVYILIVTLRALQGSHRWSDQSNLQCANSGATFVCNKSTEWTNDRTRYKHIIRNLQWMSCLLAFSTLLNAFHKRNVLFSHWIQYWIEWCGRTMCMFLCRSTFFPMIYCVLFIVIVIVAQWSNFVWNSPHTRPNILSQLHHSHEFSHVVWSSIFERIHCQNLKFHFISSNGLKLYANNILIIGFS